MGPYFTGRNIIADSTLLRALIKVTNEDPESDGWSEAKAWPPKQKKCETFTYSIIMCSHPSLRLGCLKGWAFSSSQSQTPSFKVESPNSSHALRTCSRSRMPGQNMPGRAKAKAVPKPGAKAKAVPKASAAPPSRRATGKQPAR